jgi:hypothetical protein
MHLLSRLGAPVFLRSASHALPLRAMGSSAPGRRDPAENPVVGKLRELFTGDTAGESGGESSVSLILPVASGEVNLEA